MLVIIVNKKSIIENRKKIKFEGLVIAQNTQEVKISKEKYYHFFPMIC